ncbi:DUF3515 family protein [Aquipuribacter sp. SD81]|uniref:DUF3515 family protein n=1 Tax=Aquipuribacter sp. SD81 TaxID=3127703 RepID=UPI003017868A
MPGRQRLRPGPAALAPAAALLLGACSGPLAVEAGPDAAAPACDDLLAALPRTVAGEPARQTTGAGTAAWGDPAVLLRCGVEPTGPTAAECVTVTGPQGEQVDWVLLASSDAGAILTTYGRRPAVEVEVPATYGPATLSVLPEVGPAVAGLPSEAVCLG